MVEKKNEKQSWWYTSCPYCQRIRLYVVWFAIMLAVYLYFWN